ncbi:MAG: insulinase family protein [Prevotellaceae bacterium]|jgi:predicted Zn-dependent peptidase|nr:insulinase family protein [Prevotellaceae bacterium]
MKKIFSIIIIALICTIAINAQQLDRSIRPKPAPAKKLDIKDAQTFTLKNGLKVFVVEDNRAPVVYYSLRLDIKPELERDKAGMQSLFGGVIGNATTNLNKEQLAKEIDLIGARIEANAAGGYATGLKKYQDKLLSLMSDIIFNPLFEQSELDLNKEQIKSGLSMITDDPSQINSRLSAILVYGKDFPNGEVETVESIESVTVQDLQQFHNTYFAPNVARLVIVGDITLKEAKKAAEKYFGKWKKKDVKRTQYTVPVPPSSAQVAIVNKDGAPQSTINITYPIDYKPGDLDESAISILEHVFGGGMSSRLFQNLRETHSYTYGIYSRIDSGDETGLFELSSGRGAASVKGDATKDAIAEIFKEMNGMRQDLISDIELKDAKAAIEGNFGRSIAAPRVIANFAVNIDKYNLPKDYYKNYLKRLEAVTSADVQAAAKKYLTPENAWLIVVGDKSHAEALKDFVSNKTVQFYDINGNKTEAPVAKSADIGAAQIIENYVNAIGGKAAIENITSYKMTGEMEMMGQKVSVLQAFKKPNRTLMEIGMNGRTIQKIVFDGTKLSMSGMHGNQEFTEGDEFEAMKADASVCPELNYIQNGYQLTVKGIEQMNGKDAYALEVQKGKTATVEYYDVESGLKLKTVSAVETPQGMMQQSVEYEDYKGVSGVKFPHTQKQSAAGMTMATVIHSVEINRSVDDLF